MDLQITALRRRKPVFIFSLLDGNSMYLRNLDVYENAHMTFEPNRPPPSAAIYYGFLDP
jgi:hypothetical protein